MNQTTPQVSLLWATPNPINVVVLAAKQTVMRIPEVGKNKNALIEFLYKADHRSTFEHVCMCLHITGVSRAFMSQITRHRLASFTCSSQHYQNYSEYPIVSQQYTKQMTQSIEEAMRVYEASLDAGIAKDQARMVLPEAMTVNMVMTANAREWAEILHQRLCHRNTLETQQVAKLIYAQCLDWFVELFKFVGPQCYEGVCKQGRLGCTEPYYAAG